MPFNIGCPSCGDLNSKELHLSTTECFVNFAVEKTHQQMFDHYMFFTPHICMNCGTIYIKRDDLNIIKKEMQNSEEEISKNL